MIHSGLAICLTAMSLVSLRLTFLALRHVLAAFHLSFGILLATGHLASLSARESGVAIRAEAKIDPNSFFTAFLLVKYH